MRVDFLQAAIELLEALPPRRIGGVGVKEPRAVGLVQLGADERQSFDHLVARGCAVRGNQRAGARQIADALQQRGRLGMARAVYSHLCAALADALADDGAGA
ncbi:hypothetical protein DP43_2886 [Burkholderia pseudomallei]|nr:hypothetical protein DP43_2886 [Burkholderia pseudomallei]